FFVASPCSFLSYSATPETYTLSLHDALPIYSSISMLGKKLQRLGVVSEDELKTDFNYTKFNLSEDLTDNKARQYARWVFKKLDKEELRYIRNDVILLAKSVYYYSDLFKGFDYSKRTFTSNILDSYNTNHLTSFQL